MSSVATPCPWTIGAPRPNEPASEEPMTTALPSLFDGSTASRSPWS